MNAGKLITGLLAFFLVCALVTSECVCDRDASSRLRIPAFLVVNEESVRCYPVHENGNDPDWTYSWHTNVKLFHDSEYADMELNAKWENVPSVGYAWGVYLAGYECTDTVGEMMAHTVGAAIGSHNYTNWLWSPDDAKYYIKWVNGFRSVQWDFTGLPVGAVVQSSTLHTRVRSNRIGLYSVWTDQTMHLHTQGEDVVTLPLSILDTNIDGDYDAGTSWIGGTQPYLVAHGDFSFRPATDFLTGPSHGSLDMQNQYMMYMGWGSEAAGACSYIDIEYFDYCSVSSLVPASVSMDDGWETVEIHGTGFNEGCVVTVDDDFELGLYTRISSSKIAATVRYIGGE